MPRAILILMLGLATPAAHELGGLEAAPTGLRVAAGVDLADGPLYAVSTRPDRIGRIIAPVHINGQGPFRFMLDTGANRTVLSDGAVRRLGLIVDESTITVRGVNGTAHVPTVLVERLNAGALQFDNVELPILAGPVLDRLDGILGMDGLSGKKITADFVRDRVTIAESRGRRAPLNRIVLRADPISGQLMMIEGRIGRIPVKAVIDTGSKHTLGNPALQRALAARRAPGRRPEVASVVDATEQLEFGEVIVSPTIWLGRATIRNTTVTYGDFDIFRVWGLTEEPALLIGMDVLGTLAEFTIDYRRRELHLLARGS